MQHRVARLVADGEVAHTQTEGRCLAVLVAVFAVVPGGIGRGCGRRDLPLGFEREQLAEASDRGVNKREPRGLAEQFAKVVRELADEGDHGPCPSGPDPAAYRRQRAADQHDELERVQQRDRCTAQVN